MKSKEIIEKLQLLPHPEGGFYKETYRSDADISIDGNVRHLCTSIYYLLEDANRSRFHRIKSDELWFFHLGEPLEIITLNNGRVETRPPHSSAPIPVRAVPGAPGAESKFLAVHP